jgi:hypothetical protein
MRRDKRPFVVEVKRGAKRASPAQQPMTSPSFDEVFQRAEQALFGNPVDVPTAAPVEFIDPAGGEQPIAPRRILEALPGEGETVATPLDDLAPKRRGRKPGSKNKPREVIAAEPKRRGRPPRAAGGSVRSVPVTADIVTEALDKIARVTPAIPAPSGARTLFAEEGAAPLPVKRGRGRPRKIIPEGGFPPKIPEWIAWAASSVDDDEPTSAANDIQDFDEFDEREFQPTVAPSAERFPARRDGLRAGLRWTRRLRGIAAIARQRRARKA